MCDRTACRLEVGLLINCISGLVPGLDSGLDTGPEVRPTPYKGGGMSSIKSKNIILYYWYSL